MKYLLTNKLSLFGLVLVLCFSCSDVLDETPDNRTQIDSAEKIGELLTGAYIEAGYAPFLTPRTDNATDKGPSANDNRLNTEMYFWRDVFEPDSDFPVNYWNSAYAAIAQANQALQSIDELGGGPELDRYKAEALLCRAYAHYMLVNIWSSPYDPATAATDLGIPYVEEPESVLIKQYERGTVQGVYDNIIRDLEEALPIVTNDYKVVRFHFNRDAAYSFASRVYLQTAQWDKVIANSNIALGADALQLRDWTNQYNALTFSGITARYSSVLEPTNNLIVTGASLFNRTRAGSRYQLRSELRQQLFSSNNPTGKQWSYRVFGNDLFLNIPKYQEYFRFTNASAGIGFPFVTYVLLSNDEVILNRAEAYAMLGQFDLATADINRFLSVKTQNYNPATDQLTAAQISSIYAVNDATLYTPYYTLTAETVPFINSLMELRRREFYQEGLRWFDIRRFDIPVRHTDVNDNEFLLPKGDPRRLMQIPNEAVSFGIQANPR